MITKLNVLSQELLAYARQIEESLTKGIDIDVLMTLGAKAGQTALGIIEEAHSVGEILLRDTFRDGEGS